MRSCSGLTFMLCTPSVVKMRCVDALVALALGAGRLLIIVAAAGSVKRGVLSDEAGWPGWAGEQGAGWHPGRPARPA